MRKRAAPGRGHALTRDGAAISRDEGKTWGRPVILESEPDHGYCYTAIHFAGENVLLAYCCGGGATSHVLQDLRIRCFPWRELAT